MDELVQWLVEQLDEDERIAKAAAEDVGVPEWTGSDESGHAWRYQHGGVWGDHDGLCSDAPEVVATNYKTLQRHIASHDPARVLQEIDAKRRIIAEHDINGRQLGDHMDCQSYDFPCLTLRLLALPYADRPSYRDEWRP
ncbi:DUF6221 family protein [Streptomyces sp. NPDC002265]|uniref:DUF6221 family protein n=1 Tax=Streptomyces sp. NPDC002265 TaxID=3154415 RepID=UPI003329B12C